MAKLDWQTVELHQGVYREPSPDENRIVLWILGNSDGVFRFWDRVSNVPGAKIVEEQGVCNTEAACLPARQKIAGVFGKLFNVFRRTGDGTSWLVPSGGSAEQAGERISGMMLIW